MVGVNAELFSRDRTNVPMLLRLLEEEPAGVADFHVRYHALQVLTGLASSPHRLQEVRKLARASWHPAASSKLPAVSLTAAITLQMGMHRFPVSSNVWRAGDFLIQVLAA